MNLKESKNLAIIESLTYEQVANYLLKRGFELTALEFQQEIIEANETVPKILSEHFQLGKLTVQDGQALLMEEKDKRISILEYELRIAKEDLAALREKSSTSHSHHELDNSQKFTVPSLSSNVNKVSESKVTSQETKALNFIVLKYLTDQRFKLSTITFKEETSNTNTLVSNWFEVGFPGNEAPSLATLFRYFYRTEGGTVVKGELTQVEKENETIKKKYFSLEEKYSELKHRFDELAADKRILEEQLKKFKESKGANLNTLSKEDEMESSNSVNFETESSNSVDLGLKKEKILHERRKIYLSLLKKIEEEEVNLAKSEHESENYDRITQQLLKLTSVTHDRQTALTVIGESLPFIVPGVILKRREELIPTIICVISLHTNPSVRYTLTQLLFNLIKKPDKYERKIIMEACVTLATIIGYERVERELLPQCWDQINNEHYERRILVADACGALANYVREELLPTLILSILQQLQEDKNGLVRAAVAKNLGLLITYFDKNEKYGQVEDLFFKFLNDVDIEVRNSTQYILAPLFVDWANSVNSLYDKLLIRWFSELDKNLLNTSDEGVRKLTFLISTLTYSIPFINQSFLLSFPSEKTEEHSLRDSLPSTDEINQFLAKETTKPPFDNWPTLKWITENLIPRIIQILLKVESSNSNFNPLITMFSTFCSAFGIYFTSLVITPIFKTQLQIMLEKDLIIYKRLLHIYLTSVLPYSKENLITILKELIKGLNSKSNQNKAKLSVLVGAIPIIFNSFPDQKENILNMLADCASNTSEQVRLYLIDIYDSMSLKITAEEIKKIIPTLVDIANDTNHINLRGACINVFANIAINVQDISVLDKIISQFKNYLDEDSLIHAYRIRMDIMTAFQKMIPQVHLDHHRESFIVPRMLELTERNAKNNSTYERTTFARNLFETFKALMQVLDAETLREKEQEKRDKLINALRTLEKEFEVQTDKITIQSMISELEGDEKAKQGDKKWKTVFALSAKK